MKRLVKRSALLSVLSAAAAGLTACDANLLGPPPGPPVTLSPPTGGLLVTTGNEITVYVTAKDAGGRATYPDYVAVIADPNVATTTLGRVNYYDMSLSGVAEGKTSLRISVADNPDLVVDIPVTVATPVANIITFNANERNLVAGQPFGAESVLKDQLFFTLKSYSGPVSVALIDPSGAGPSVPQLRGPSTTNAVQGRAFFNGISVDQGGREYVVRVTTPGGLSRDRALTFGEPDASLGEDAYELEFATSGPDGVELVEDVTYSWFGGSTTQGTITVGANGIVAMGTPSAVTLPGENQAFPAGISDFVAPFWDDLDASGLGQRTVDFEHLTGATPSQNGFRIRWAARFEGLPDSDVTFTLVHRGTRYQFIYERLRNPSDPARALGAGATIGLQGNGQAFAHAVNRDSAVQEHYTVTWDWDGPSGTYIRR